MPILVPCVRCLIGGASEFVLKQLERAPYNQSEFLRRPDREKTPTAMKRLELALCVLAGCLAVCASSVSAAQPAANLASAWSPKKHRVARKRAAQKKHDLRKGSLRTVSTRGKKSYRRYHYRRHYFWHRRYRYRGPVRPSRDRIEEIQSALQREGYFKRDPDGIWGPETVHAMRNFQEDHGLDGTGKIDALTLQKLGLGSEIAGVDAPRPPTPAAQPGAPVQPAAAPAAVPADPARAKPQTPQPQTPKSLGTGSTNPPATSNAAPAAPSSAPASSRDSSASKPASRVQ